MATQLQHFGRGALRVAKNYTKGYSDTQTKVRDATSNDPWGPSGTQMNELAQLTYKQGDFVEIMEMLDKRLNDKGKNWRHVFKALTVLDYILHAGSENVVIYFKDNLYIVKTLKEFVYVDDQGKDVGHNVRQKAKDITNLLQDEDRLRAERRQRGAMRDRMLGNIADHGLQGEDDYGGRDYNSSWRDQERRPRPAASRRPGDDEDSDLQRALQESMQSQQDEDRRRSQAQREEDELARAIRLSEEEEAKRKREMEEANQRALMDDNFQLESNNLYSQQQQQPQQTGFPLVDMGGGWNQQQLQPQYTSFNPFAAQMQQQQLQQQQMYQQQLQQQQQEEYMRQQQEAQARAQMQASLLPQHTAYGSNNPFAPKPNMPQQTGSLFDTNPQHSIQPQQTGLFTNQFSPQNNSFSTPQNNASSTTPQPSFNPQPKKDDGEHAGLANLIGRGREDGLDTFGNVGNLRIPVGSGFHNSNRLAMQQTGLGANNPFGQQQNHQQQQQQQQQNNEQPFFTI